MVRKAKEDSDSPRDGFPIVGIGASAGGLEAFTQLLQNFSPESGVALVVVQHLDPNHESMLAAILSRHTSMPVLEVSDGMRVRPDHVFVMPPNATMQLTDGTFKVLPRRRGESTISLPIDDFFESLAEIRKSAAVGVVLSGNASDGTLGLKAIKAAGGITLAQSEESARFPGMPHSAISAGVVDFALPPQAIGRQISRLAKHPLIRTESEALPAGSRKAALHEVFTLLRATTGVDFSHYRQSTILRRMSRRMLLSGVTTVEDFVSLLKKKPSEIQALYGDLLITVTSFFRDPLTFQFLRKRILPQLFRKRSSSTPVRVWVPGCSTGEEAYSLAIALFEAAGAGSAIPVQIFATDVNEDAIARARRAVYDPSITKDVSPERLRRFFVKVGGRYQIAKRIRDACVFARQNIVADPPFSNLDLLSCRNLFIYLEPELQKKIYPVFHHVLRPGGYLVLGPAESILGFQDLFAPADRKHRVYRKKPAPSRGYLEFPSRHLGETWHAPASQPATTGKVGTEPSEMQRATDRLLLANYTPPGVVVDGDLEIVYVRGRTGPYLEPSSGRASMSLLQMAREGLLPDLRSAIKQARQTNARAVRENVRFRSDGRSREVNLEVLPLQVDSPERYVFVVFHPVARAEAAAPGGPARSKRKAASELEHNRRELETGRRELASTREYLQTIIEEREAANEELKSANEEILSSNEELQSTNEELSTAKEELQSSNEELTTLNEELQNRNSESSRMNDDLVNLLSSIQIPILMLDMEGRIRRFTPAAARLFNLLPTDVDRPIHDIRADVEVPDLLALGREAIETGVAQGREVRDGGGRWWLLRVHPYFMGDRRIDSFVCSFTDIDSHKKALEEAETRREFARGILATVPQALLVLEADLRVFSANETFYKMFGAPPEQAQGRRFEEVTEGVGNLPQLRQMLEQLVSKGAPVESAEVEQNLRELGSRTLLITARPLRLPRGDRPLILVAIEDITEIRRAYQAEKRKLEQELRQLQKLDSIGRMAGGMAHDFNNILNIISSYAERAIRLDDPEKRNESFDAIRGAVGRGSAVVRHLLTFARRDEGSFRVVDVNEILRDVLQMVQASFPRNIRVVPDLDTTLPLAHADPNQLHQTFLNLFVNARDAMPDGGELRVTTALKPSGELRRQHPEAARDFYICVMVRDEGLGMDDETRQRVFEPFFTTKGRTGGSGMGLAVVYGVVTSHQGFVDFDTAFGEGTVFRIYLPVFTAMQAAPEGGGAPQAEKRPPGGTETILFVEDEEMLLTAVGDILRQQGYRVLTASTGEQALEIYRKNRKSIDLVVSDLELPQSSGWDTFLEMRKRAPKLDAVIVSGYVEPALREKMIDGGARAFLRKPYTAEALLSAIRQALDERRPRKSPLKRAAPAEKTRRSGSARRQSKRRRAARRPLAMAPGTVPFSSRSVASPAKKRVRATGSARRAGADEPPTA